YIFKYAENNKSKTGLSGAEFLLFSDANCTVPVGKTIVTNAQGYAVTPLLQPDQYWVKEIKAPDGYMLDSRYAPTVKTLVIKAIHSPDISNADMAKRQNYVEFLNVKSAEPIGMPVSIHKTVSPNALAQSLMQSNSTVVFEISNFTTGKNTIPMESFTISDTKIVLKDAGGMAMSATKDDYSMRKVTVNKAYNIDDVTAEIKARVSYQINGA
ncbi:MAG: prealbumin-like fold domain-containing protein, partial [Oscillospiraceae bacterium]